MNDDERQVKKEPRKTCSHSIARRSREQNLITSTTKDIKFITLWLWHLAVYIVLWIYTKLNKKKSQLISKKRDSNCSSKWHRLAQVMQLKNFTNQSASLLSHREFLSFMSSSFLCAHFR